MTHLVRWPSRLLISLSFAIASSTAFAQRIGPFDFDYRISGHPDARPQQVFDDGLGKTYFQFKPGATVPVIFVGAGPDMQLPAVEGPYHVVGGRARDYTLVAPAGTARVRHSAVLSGAQPSSTHPEAAPSRLGPTTYRTTDRTVSSYATPVRGDVIEWTEPDAAAPVDVAFRGQSVQLPAGAVDRLAASIHQAGRSSQILIDSSALHPSRLLTRRISSLRRALIAAGAEPARISSGPADGPSLLAPTTRPRVGLGRDVLRVRWQHVRGAPRAVAPGIVSHQSLPPLPPGLDRPSSERVAGMGRPVAGQFDLLVSDGTVAVALGRWATDAGYDLHWDTSVHAPVTGELTLDAPSFPEAAERVIAGLRASGYPLQLKTSAGRDLRVVRTE